MFFRTDRKKQDGRSGIWLAETLSTTLKPLNRVMETWQEARSQCPLQSFVLFWADPKKQNGRPGLWLAETFSTSSLKLLNRIQRNLTGSKISLSTTKFVFWGGWSEKTRWPPWPPTAWDIFDFSETAEWNSTKLDRKQDFILLLLILCLSGRSENQDGRPGLWLAETFFDFFPETAERNSTTSPKNFSFCNSNFLRVTHS